MLKVGLFGCVAISMMIAYLREFYRHKQALVRIPIRVHINGTRGKSSLTRLIAAGLRAGGIPTLAKTTGTLARLILPSGQEVPIARLGKPNIIEQIGVARRAVDCGARALVIECMALDPKLQALSESMLVRSTVGVITNARADHLEIMGPGMRDVARALARSIPRRGILFTAEKRHLLTFERIAQERQTAVVGPEDFADRPSEAEMLRFSYVEHSDNVALALAVCRHLGVSRSCALAGMWRSRPDVGAMRFYQQTVENRRIVFASAFAANDPESTRQLWQLALDRHRDADCRVLMINCRADRSARSQQFARDLLNWRPVDCYLVTGQHTHLFAKLGRNCGLPPSKFTLAEGDSAFDLISHMKAFEFAKTLIVGVGNIAGAGIQLVEVLNSAWTILN